MGSLLVRGAAGIAAMNPMSLGIIVTGVVLAYAISECTEVEARYGDASFHAKKAAPGV